MRESKQLWAHVDALHRKFPETRVFGIHTNLRWPEGDALTVGKTTFAVRHCQSPLEVREAVVEAEVGTRPMVVLTGLDEVSLGQDLLTYFGRRRLFEIEPWSLLKELFAAHAVDPRIYGRKWMVQALLDLVPSEGYTPAPSGVLTVDRVWEVLLDRALGLAPGRPDALDLLRWTMSEDVVRFSNLSGEFKDDLKAWLAETAGLLGELILGCIQEGYANDVVSIGLACEVIFAEVPTPPASLGQAAIRLERFTGSRSVPPAVGRQWGQTARRVAADFGNGTGGDQERLAVRGDEIIGEAGVAAWAHLSDLSVLGFHQRVETLGKAILTCGDTVNSEQILKVEEAARHVLVSAPGRLSPDRSYRIEMAVRLLRWLATDPTRDLEGSGLDTVVASYARDGGYVDWAREALVAGDSHPVLMQSFEKLRVRVANKREKLNERFARLLVITEQRGSSGPTLLPVEDFLDAILAKFAARIPVLLVTMDGMSWGVFRELLDDLQRQGWKQVWLDECALVPSLLAGFPSLTNVSRTSLLCGEAKVGTSADEKVRFQSHPRLKEAGRATHPPVLFHKGDLGSGGGTGLSSTVAEEVRSSQRRVVGVVLNAVDDHLTKGEQVFVAWTLQSLPLLNSLLGLAREAGRVVVFTSDHGHVLDRGMLARLHEDDGERYRVDNGTLDQDEIILTGPRVLLPASGRVIMPWSENVRYKARKNGYHGGASLQEMVVPLQALYPEAKTAAGCHSLPVHEPNWWRSNIRATANSSFPGNVAKAQNLETVAETQAELLFQLEVTL